MAGADISPETRGQLRYFLESMFYAVLAAVLLFFAYTVFLEAENRYQSHCRATTDGDCYSFRMTLFATSVGEIFYDRIVGNIYESAFQGFLTYVFFGSFAILEKHWRHYFREYDDVNVIGWNIIYKDHDGKLVLEIPSEETFFLNQLMQDDEVMLDKVKNAAKQSKKGYPDFMIALDDPNDQEEFNRRICNKVSQTIKSSMWPQYAHVKASSLNGRRRKLFENPISITVSEKNPDMKTYVMRTWLIFPSTLKEMLKYSLDELSDPNGPFKVAKSHWRIRLKNLRLWAEAEYQSTQLDKLYLSNEILIPLNRE
jgi:hypothetical protein